MKFAINCIHGRKNSGKESEGIEGILAHQVSQTKRFGTVSELLKHLSDIDISGISGVADECGSQLKNWLWKSTTSILG